MAATRKLQGEIDRCLKKVTEGVDTFEDIWQKVHNATNNNQKEKYEADLKKEIKKLQRLRDQIKSWIASAEIKDKSTLYDYRKLIETQMERFKVVERETKTKAYSKEGLGAAQKLDPAQKEREDISCWLVASIDALNIQLDQFESEIESLLVSKKKKLDKEKQDRMEELKNKLEKHRFHIKKLETLLRMLDNMSVEVNQIRRIKDDVEYYVDSSQDPDFNENEYIYDDIIGLDDIELSGVGLPSSATTDSNNSNDTGVSPTSITSGTSPIASPGLGLHNHSTDSMENLEKKKKIDEIISKPVKPMAVRAISSSNNTSNVSSVSNSTSNNSSILNSSVSLINSVTNSLPPNQTTPTTNNSKPTLVSSTPSKTQQNSLSINNVSPAGLLLHPFNNDVVENGPVSQQHHLQNSQNHQTHCLPQISSSVQVVSMNMGAGAEELPVVTSPASPPRAASPSAIQHRQSSRLNGPIVSPPPPPASPPSTHAPALHSLKSIAAEAVEKAGLERTATHAPETLATAMVPPLLGVAPLGPEPLQKDHQLQLQMTEATFYHLPHPSDAERARNYLPRNMCPTPLYYNQVLLPHSDTVDFYQRLSTETLFFVFYYMEGTKAQYLAAKALKKQSWRFHTKYMMWFQRHEEPKIINEEYEQGTYIYFDYEKWGQRKKEGFTFEYKYLEDRDLN
ncbi:CCR4-associated factor Not3 isoform X2 [Arctopsyche grandis]|uniref:CCR4-associated factor Not3 isoform X2 n=1 Tax=Arctopsyche grandis TaxID=121162 RepID=UPI00406D7CF9